MKKRVLSIILALAMIMTMIPQTVFAETSSGSEGYLAYRYARYDDGFFMSYDEPLRTTYASRKDMTSEVYFFFVEGDTETPILASEIYSSDENILETRAAEDYLVSLVPQAYGTATIDYEKDGKVYSVAAEVQLEDYGYSTSPELTTDSIVDKFSVSEVGDKLYFATRDGYEFDEVELLEEFQNIATAEISDDNTYITITFKAIPDNNEIYELAASYVIDEENSHHVILPITLYDGSPGLRYRFATWSPETESYYGDPNDELLDTWEVEPDSRSTVIFYYVEKGVETEIALEDLIVSDSSVVSLSEEWGGGALAIQSVGFGHATIGYMKDGVEYTVDVSIPLPTAAFYKEPIAKESSYIQNFTVTKDSNTFYYVLQEGWELTTFEVDGDCREYATVTLSEDKTYLTIQMNEETPNGFLNIWCEMESEDDWESYSSHINIESGRAALVYKDVWYNGTDYVEDGEGIYYLDFNMDYNSGTIVHFYFKEGENATSVSPAYLTSADESIVTVEAIENSEYIVEVRAVGAGETEILYTLDGVSYTIPVRVELPIIGLYSTPEASADTIIDEFNLTENVKDFYIVTRDGWEITEYELEYDFDDYATAIISEDCTYVKVTVSDEIVSTTYYMFVKAYNEERQDNISDWIYTRINNSLPGLRYGNVYFDGNEIIESEEPLSTSWITEPGWSTLVGFYYFANGEKLPVKSSDLVISDEDVVRLEAIEGTEYAVYMDSVGCGEATISYTVNGKTYSVKVIVDLPEFGFYSSPNANQDTYLDQFISYNGRDTFYFVARNGWELTDVRLEDYLADIAEVTIDPLSRTYATIKITGEIEDFHAYLSYDAINNELGDTIEDWGCGLYIENGNPDLKFKYGIEEDGEIIEIEDSSYVSTFWGENGLTAYVYLYHVENGEGTRVKYNQVTSSNNKIVKVQKCDQDANATVLQFVGFGEATIDYTLNGKIYSIDVSSELPGSGFFSTTDFKEETFITEFGVTETNKTFYLMTSGEALFNKVTLLGNAAEYAEIKILANKQIVEIKITGDLEGEEELKIDAVLDVPMYDYSYDQQFSITLYNDIQEVILKGWQFIDGNWYFYDDEGQKVCNQWKKDSKGWCFLGEAGAMLTSQWVKDSVGYCFVDASGYMVYNKWVNDGNGWAYAGSDGYRQTSKWIKDSVGWCYVGTDGYMVCNDWVADSKDYVYLGESGYMVTNKWIETENGWCYVGSDGYKVTNKWVKDSTGWCYLGEDGFMLREQWVKDSKGYCYVDESGYMVYSQWINDETGSRYVDASGYLVTNKWLMADDKWIYAGSDGYKVTSKWVKDSKGWCYLDENGHMVYNDWVADSKGLCYVDASGYMVTNKWIAVDEEWCYVGEDGYKVTNKWVKDSVGWCYLGEDGFMLRNQWVKDSTGYCYVDGSGYMVYSKWIDIGENRYYVNASGYRVENAWVQLEGKWYYFKEDGIMARNETIGSDYVDENGVWVQ